MLFLRRKPQHIPYSPLAAIYTAFAFVLTGVLVLQSTLHPAHVVQGMILALLIQLVFTYLLLHMMDKQARFVQTITALLGVSMMFNLMVWPLFHYIAEEPVSLLTQQVVSLLYILMLSWEVLVKAHIYRYALEMQLVSALLISLSLLFIGFAVSQILLPQPSA